MAPLHATGYAIFIIEKPLYFYTFHELLSFLPKKPILFAQKSIVSELFILK